MREEPPLPQRVRESEHAAAIDADQVCQLPQRDRLRRRGNGLEDGETAIETLDGWRVVNGFAVHHRNIGGEDTAETRKISRCVVQQPVLLTYPGVVMSL
jgi:hypothetical protein